MPHYANGKPATLGELVISVPPTPTATRVIGILAGITPGSETCNCQVMALARQYGTGPWLPVGIPQWPDCMTVKELLPAGVLAEIAEAVST